MRYVMHLRADCRRRTTNSAVTVIVTMISYYRSTVTTALSCIVSHI